MFKNSCSKIDMEYTENLVVLGASENTKSCEWRINVFWL